MKLFKKENLYIPTTQPTTQEPDQKTSRRKWIPYGATALFLMIVIASLFFVDGSLLPSNDDTEYKTSQDVLLPMVNVSSLNPLVSKDADTYYISKLIYESLFTVDDTMAPIPQLVEKYTVNPGKLYVSMILKQGIKWQDGKKFTAADVKYTIDALKAAGEQSLYNTEISKISSVKVSGSYKVVVYFESATEMGLDLLTFPILPKHQFDSISEAVQKVSKFKPVGTGPYKYKGFDPTTRLILTANEGYVGEVPQNRLVFQVLPKKVNFFNLLKASNLSLIISKAATRESEVSGEDVKVVDFPSNEMEFIGYNFSNVDLAKRSVRIAVASAIDPQSVIDESFYGSGIAAESLYFPGYLGVEPLEEAYAFDTDVSEDYLLKAGYKDKNGDGYVENADGETLTVRILVNSNNTSRVLAAKEIRGFLKDVGIKATVDKVDWATYLAKLNAGDFDLYLGGMKLSKSMDLRSLLSTGGDNNYLGYGNGKLDDLLNQIRSGQTPSELQKTYKDVRTILHDDLPYFCLLYKTYGAIQSKALVGEATPNFDNYYKGCGGWYCRYEVTTETTSQ
jgi:peptide/nickel transport system substrate-binding protein